MKIAKYIPIETCVEVDINISGRGGKTKGLGFQAVIDKLLKKPPVSEKVRGPYPSDYLDRECYTREAFDKATKALFEQLNAHFPHAKREVLSCVDIQGTFPVAHWRPEERSPVCLTIALQDDGSTPYAVVSAYHSQTVKTIAEHKGVVVTASVENIYPDEFVHLQEIIAHLLATPITPLTLAIPPLN